MSAILLLMAITVHIQMVSGMLNNTVIMRVQKGERVDLKCCCHGLKRTWIGPSKNKTTKLGNAVYFSNNQRNPNLNLSKYFVQKNEGGYDLIISNFQQENTGTYICRYENTELYNETKYDVSILENETTGIEHQIQISFQITSNIPVINKTTDFQVPKNQSRNKEPNLLIMLVPIVVFLLGCSLTILGCVARKKWKSLGDRMSSFFMSFRGDVERHTGTEDTNEQDYTVENQMFQLSNVPLGGNSSQPAAANHDITVQQLIKPIIYINDADLGVIEESGATSNHRGINESTSVDTLHILQASYPSQRGIAMVVTTASYKNNKRKNILQKSVSRYACHVYTMPRFYSRQARHSKIEFMGWKTGQFIPKYIIHRYEEQDDQADFIYIHNLDVIKTYYKHT